MPLAAAALPATPPLRGADLDGDSQLKSGLQINPI